MIFITASTHKTSAPPSPALEITGDPAKADTTPILRITDAPGGTVIMEVRENAQTIFPSGTLYINTIYGYTDDPRLQRFRLDEQTANPSTNPQAGLIYFYVFKDTGTGAHYLRIKLSDGTTKQVQLT